MVRKMGLDAVVYKSKRKLVDDPSEERMEADERSRDLLPKHNLPDPAFSRESTEVLHKRLGNVAAVETIRKEICKAQGQESNVLLGKVLYSSTHSGDTIELDSLDTLLREVSRLRKVTEGSRSMLLTNFIEDMLELIWAAQNEGNPIVFV